MSEASSPSPKRKWFTMATRLLGVVVVCVLVSWQWERVAEAGSILKQGAPSAWLVAGALQFACLLVAAFRFSILLRAVGHKIPLLTLYVDLVCTTALNAALLMGVGDLYRVKRTNKFVDNLALSGSVIVLDRILGFAVICAVAVLAMSAIGAAEYDLHASYLLIALVALVAGLVFLRVLAKYSTLPLWSDIQRPFLQIAKQPALGILAVLASVTLSIGWLAAIVVIAWGLGIEAGIAPIVFAAAVVTVATVLPVSVGGIGVREAGYAILLASHGVETAQAIALGVAQYALLLPVMAAGALLGLRRR